ncbi:MAG: DUF1629 domain-containing protein [Pseudomonadota bacterium]
MQFYYLHFREKDEGGVAYAPAHRPIDAIEQLDEKTDIPFIFYLQNGELQDYQANNLGWPLFSAKLKTSMEPLCDTKNVAWLEAIISDEAGKKHSYFVPRFIKEFDVLDKQKSIFGANNFVVKAHLDKEKVMGLDFFPVPGSTTRIIISDRIKKILVAGAFTGIDFGHVAIN